jgi:hypothetical protein
MNYITEKEKKTPVKGTCDVVVAGGGVAGIAAALSAVRNGATVKLIEKQCLLGGLGTLGIVTIYLPLCDGMGNQIVYGIGEELLKLSIKYGCEARYPDAWLNNGSIEEKRKKRYEVQYNPQLFAIAAEQLLLSEGVEVIYDTHITGVNVTDNSITEVIVDNKEGHYAISTKAVVDCTGDADICEFAGENVETYRENRWAAWYYYSHKNGYKLQMMATPYRGKPTERTYDGLLSDDINQLLIRGHKVILEDVLKKRKDQDDESIMPVTIPVVPPVRMTRRLSGAYTLDISEEGTEFEDSIGKISDWRKAGPVYDLPYRILYGNKISNLSVAGRCVSVTTDMWDVTRVIPNCALTGEAAGAAAALSVKNNTAFKDVDINKLQDILRINTPR